MSGEVKKMSLSRPTRRGVVGGAAAAAAVASSALGQGAMNRVSKPHVVVIGGGAGGASFTRKLAMRGAGEVDVTLVEANATYESCFFSNHYLGGFRTSDTLAHRYDRLERDLGVQVIHDRAIAVDRGKQKVELNNSFLNYDLLVLAPGIDFDESSVRGWSFAAQDRMPHAYQGGAPVRLLRQQIEAMPKGGVFAMVPPNGLYRCPPGPYERVTVVAHVLKSINPTAKIIIADPKPLFSKMSLFRQAWRRYYKGMIDFNSDVDMSNFKVDPEAMTITLEGEVIKVDACNVVPNQKAGAIAQLAGVAPDDWAPVHAFDMRSKLDDNVYVLGDAAAQGDMPKSAFSANSQAEVCANAILARLFKREAPTPAFANTCWSFLAPEDSVKIGASYKATDDGIKRVEGFISQRKDRAEVRKETYIESLAWYDAIATDMFGASS